MPPAPVLIRRALLTDADALIAILWDTFESTWRPQLTAAAADAYRREDRPAAYVGGSGPQFWVAERNDAPVGFVHWRADFVQALHVPSAHARTGVGARLMDWAEGEIARAGHATARLETDTFNAASRAFYASRGYREAGRYPDEEWNSALTTLLLVKQLASA